MLVAASDQSFIDLLGGVMAVMNILYFILFMCRYNSELEKALDREAEWSAGVKVNSNLGAELKDAVGEWNLLVMSLENDDGMEERRRLQIVDEMPFVKSRIVAAMRISLMETEEKQIMNVTHQISETFNTGRFRQKCRRFQRVLDPVNEDFEKFVGEARGPFNVLEIAREQKLEFVSGVLERGDGSAVEEGEGNNPLQQIEMTATAAPEKGKKNHGKSHIAGAEGFKQEHKARAKSNSNSKSKSRSTEKPPPPPPPTTLAAAKLQQNILGGSPPPPPPPLPPPTRPPPPPPKPDPWISVTDSEGKLYYINRDTNETRWERP